MDEEAPLLESELQPLWQMAHNYCKDKEVLTGGALPYDNQQKEILLLLAMQHLLQTTIHQNNG